MIAIMKVRLLLAVLISLSIFSCKKKGCTDPAAVNYSEEAQKDDESCTYNGHVVFWFNSVTATNLVNASIPSVDFYIDGVSEGSVSMTQFSSSAPVCSGPDGFTATVDLGSSTSVSKTYSIKESGTSTIIQSGTISISNTPCKWVELTY